MGFGKPCQFLKNEGKEIDKQFFDDMDWLKKLRNDIEHHKFEMDVAQVRRTIGRLTKAMLDFNDAYAHIDLTEHVEAGALKVFEALADDAQS